MPRSQKFLQFFNGSRSEHTRILNAPESSSPGPLQAQWNEKDDEVEILMHDAIGDDWVGLDSATITKQIKQSAGKRLVFDINSFGGSAYDGIAIYNAAAQHDSEVVAKITGIGYSAASIIPMAADKIIIAENGSLGIHPAWMFAVGNRFAMEDNAKWLATLDDQIIDTYAARTGQKRDKIVEWFEGSNHDGTVFSGKEALEYGFADELLPLKKKSSGKEDSKKGEISSRLKELQSRHAAAMRREMLAKMRQSIGAN